MSSNTGNALFIKPIRNSNNSQYLLYDTTSGEVTYGTNTSDDRLKHNEIDITNGLEIIRQLKPQFYKKHAQYIKRICQVMKLYQEKI